MYRLTTPTISFSFPDYIDMTQASDVYITFTDKNNNILANKTGSSLNISDHSVSTILSQEDTVNFPDNRMIKAQVNWTYQDQGVLTRPCTEVVNLMVMENLYSQIIE